MYLTHLSIRYSLEAYQCRKQHRLLCGKRKERRLESLTGIYGYAKYLGDPHQDEIKSKNVVKGSQ